MAKPQYTRLKFDLEKLQDPLVADQFRASIGGKFGPLLLFNNDSDLESNIETFEKATNETANEILGNKTTKKKAWVTSEVCVIKEGILKRK